MRNLKLSEAFSTRNACFTTVDDINLALPLGPLNYGNHGMLLIMGNAGFISSTVIVLAPSSGTDHPRTRIGLEGPVAFQKPLPSTEPVERPIILQAPSPHSIAYESL